MRLAGDLVDNRMSVSTQPQTKLHCLLQGTNLTAGVDDNDVSLKKSEDPSGKVLGRIIHFLEVLALTTINTCSILAPFY